MGEALAKDDPIYRPMRVALHAYMAREGTTWAGLGRETGVDLPALYRFAKGEAGLRWDARDRLAAAMGLAVRVSGEGGASAIADAPKAQTPSMTASNPIRNYQCSEPPKGAGASAITSASPDREAAERRALAIQVQQAKKLAAKR